jgi:CheY-like chemotaxis protein
LTKQENIYILIKEIMARILIVEDDPQMSSMYQRAFELAGEEVDLASDGQMGLEKITETLPELVLLDIVMPKMNGIDVLTKIKSNPKTGNIPIVMLTNVLSGSLLAAQEAVNAKLAEKYIIKSDTGPNDVVAIAKKILQEKIN